MGIIQFSDHFLPVTRDVLFLLDIPRFPVQQSSITPAWYATWWLLGGLAAITIIAFSILFILLYRRLRNREKQLDLELNKRSQELSFIQAQMDILFRSSPLGIGLADLNGNVISANPALARIFGYTEKEFLEAKVQDFFPNSEQRAHLFERLEIEKIIQISRLQLQRKDGSKIIVNLTESWITSGGDEVLLGIVQDITSEIEAEEVLRSEAERLAVAAERNRLSRELHDSVTQSLYTTSLIIEALPEVWESHPEEALESLEEIRRINHGALAEMRTLLLELRPEAITGRPLGDLLRQLTEGLTARSDLPIVLTTVGDCQLPDEAQVSFYRIAQEALNNIIKHARANKVWVNLICSDEEIVMQVRDDGRGFDAQQELPHKFGLRIMRDRVQEIGAELIIDSKPEEGTNVEVKWNKSYQEA